MIDKDKDRAEETPAPRPYRTPTLRVYGDVRELTLASATANSGGDNPMFPRLKT